VLILSLKWPTDVLSEESNIVRRTRINFCCVIISQNIAGLNVTKKIKLQKRETSIQKEETSDMNWLDYRNKDGSNKEGAFENKFTS